MRLQAPIELHGAVALVFFEGRLVGGLLGIDSNVNATMAATWACLALSMVFAELANSFYDIRMNLRAPASISALSARPNCSRSY